MPGQIRKHPSPVRDDRGLRNEMAGMAETMRQPFSRPDGTGGRAQAPRR